MRGDGVDRLADAIRSVSAVDEFYSLSATASGLLATAAKPGPLLVAYLSLLKAAELCDGDAMDEQGWQRLRKVLDALVNLLERDDPARLDALGLAWRVWQRPAALQ